MKTLLMMVNLISFMAVMIFFSSYHGHHRLQAVPPEPMKVISHGFR
jgi:hypothetical protein